MKLYDYEHKDVVTRTNENQIKILNLIKERNITNTIKRINYIIPLRNDEFIMPISSELKVDTSVRELLIKQAFKKAINKNFKVTDETAMYKEREYKVYSLPEELSSKQNWHYFHTTFKIFYDHATSLVNEHLKNIIQHGYKIIIIKNCVIINMPYCNVEEYTNNLIRKHCRKDNLLSKLLGFIKGTNIIDITKKDKFIDIPMSKLLSGDVDEYVNMVIKND